VPREGIDRILICHRRQLEAVLADYLVRYNQHRPHRALDQRSPDTSTAVLFPLKDPLAGPDR
jgi:hypothetical protein